MFSVSPTAKCNVGHANVEGDLRIARIEFRRPVELSKRTLPLTAAAVNRSPGPPTKGVTRLELGDPVELSQRGIVVTMAPVMKQSQRKMCIRRSRRDR